jgi:hypothetical protein
MKYIVEYEGTVIGQRTSSHTYTHALALVTYHYDESNRREYYTGSVWHFFPNEKAAASKQRLLEKRVEHVDNTSFVVIAVRPV